MGFVFRSRQMRRTGIVYNMSMLDNSNMDLFLPTTDPFAKKCLGLITPTTLVVQVYQQHLTDPDAEAKRVHYCYVMKIEPGDTEVKFSTGSIMQAYTSSDLGTVLYSYTCNHELGDEHCKVDLDDYKENSTVASFGGYQITLADFVGVDMSFYAGGTIVNERTGQQRPIVTIDGETVFILAPFVDIVAGDPVKLWPGCDHRRDGPAGCLARFDNVINYGGFPFIPRKNPFVEGFGELNLTSSLS